MKTFTRRNSQQQHGSEQQGVKVTSGWLGSQDTLGSGLCDSPEDPYSFPGDNPQPGPEALKLVNHVPAHQRAKAAVKPPDAAAAAQRAATAPATLEHAGHPNKPPASGSIPANSGSPPKRARTEAADHSKQKASTATSGAIANNKRIAPQDSPPPTGNTHSAPQQLARAASALAGANSGKAASGRSRGGQGSGGAAKVQAGRTASGVGNGVGRSASGGARKRSKSSSPPLIDLAASAGSQTAAGLGCKLTNQPQQQQKQPPTTPVSLPTPRRPTRLIPAGLIESASLESRPAQTVMEAQERGELVQMQDDARYAMDGLVSSCSIETQRESAVTLTEMLCSRKGRLALRADGLAQQVLSSLAKLKPAKDSVLALASTVVLLMLTSEDAHPAYLASVAAAVLFDQLLQGNYSFEEAAESCAQGAKLVRMLKSRPLSSLLASTGVTGQRDLLLITLEQATSSQQASKVAAVERLKHNLRQYGALTRLGKLVAEAAADAAPSAKQLRLLLLVLENATFTCQANGQVLAQLQVAVPPAPYQSSESQVDQPQLQQSFPELLVEAANRLLAQGDRDECQQALHVCFSVLMNLSHQNPDGAAVIAAAGGMQAAAALIGLLLGPAQHSHQELCKQVLHYLELISVALGVLINLVSGEPANSRLLANTAAATSSSQDLMIDDSSSLVSLLCKVMGAVGELLQQASDDQEMTDAAVTPDAQVGQGLGSRPSARRSSTSSAEAGALDDNSAGEASIVEAYCAMLLGFLVRDCEDVALIVPKMLEGQSLQPIVDAVQRCLNFYISTGAITDHTRTTLEELLQHLGRCV